MDSRSDPNNYQNPQLVRLGLNNEVTITLMWEGPDDLDLYLKTPEGVVLFYANRTDNIGRVLDHDANANVGVIEEKPVENVSIDFTKGGALGPFVVMVNNYCTRSRGDVAFTVEVVSKRSSFRETSSGVWPRGKPSCPSPSFHGGKIIFLKAPWTSKFNAVGAGFRRHLDKI